MARRGAGLALGWLWPGLGPGWSVLLFGGLCPGWGLRRGCPASAPPTLPARLAEGRRVPSSAAQAGVRLPTDLGIWSRRSCRINTSTESAFLGPIHEPGSGKTFVLLAARL